MMSTTDWTGAGRLVLWRVSVMADYLKTHGTAKLAGLAAGRGGRAEPEFLAPGVRDSLIASENIATSIAATRAFLRDCFSKQSRRRSSSK